MSVPWRCLVSAMAAAILLCPWGVAGDRVLYPLPPVPDPGPCCPAQNATALVGLRVYRRFHANDSLIGRSVPCTRDDKICFRHNLIFDSQQDICESIGDGYDANCDLRPNITEFEKGTGRLIGVCKTYEDPCPGYRMAYDGRCYKKEVVRDAICGCGAKPTRHFLEGVECRSSPARPIHTRQPKIEGLCVIPDLRFPDIARWEFFKNVYTPIQGFIATRFSIEFREKSPLLDCDREQAACFSQNKVRVPGASGCYQLLKRGPCPSDYVVAIDALLAIRNRAEAKCVHVRGGCPEGHKRVVFDGKCHENREIKIEAPGRIVFNQFGAHILIPRGFSISFDPVYINNYCVIRTTRDAPRLFVIRPKPPCSSNDESKCDLYEVVGDPPIPEVIPEPEI